MTRSTVLDSFTHGNQSGTQTVHDLDLRAFSYDDRTKVLPAVTGIVSSGSCFLRGWRTLSLAQIEFSFEMHLRSAIEIYSALIGSGLELTQASHAELTGLCTLRRHNHRIRETPGRVVSVRLEVSFLAEMEFELNGSAGLA